MTELKLPQITNTQQDLIVDDSFTTFDNLLKHFNLPNYNASSSLKQKIEFLIASLENEQIRNKLEHKVMDLTGMIEDYENYREMEIEADTYEVKLERLKYKYHDIIEKQIDLEKLKEENIRLENELKKADSQSKLAYCKEFLGNLNDSVDINEVRKFSSLLRSDMVMYRVSEMRAKKNIQALPRNVISTFCLKLLKYKKISLEKYSETMRVEKSILQKIAFKLAFDGIAVYDGNDIIKIE